MADEAKFLKDFERTIIALKIKKNIDYAEFFDILSKLGFIIEE